MIESEAIEIVRKEKAYMDNHAGRAQSEAFQTAINALENQEKIKEVFTHYVFYGNKFELFNDCVSALNEIKSILWN